MKIREIVNFLDSIAPLQYQENYDNSGLLTGNLDWECFGVLCTLDTIEDTIQEALNKNCNLIVSHHPIIFSGLKKLTGKTYIERTVIEAVKNNIAIFAIHTNLDNTLHGVNHKMAEKLGLKNVEILLPKPDQILQFSTYMPRKYADEVQDVLFKNGAGNIGNYSECSFKHNGLGCFKPKDNAQPKIGEINKREYVEETKIECLLPKHLSVSKLLQDLKKIEYYEEIAYNIIPLHNINQNIGSGVVAELENEMDEKEFLQFVKKQFNLTFIKHTKLLQKPVKKIALCGGSGAFLLNTAKSKKVDIFITADAKYHEFFDTEDQLIFADIGHYESEQFTIELLFDKIRTKFSNFAILKTEVNTNPVHYS